MTKKSMHRRSLLAGLGAASAGLALRSFASGVPAKVLLSPLRAEAQAGSRSRMLILSSSRAGDPVNANIPGTYGFDDVFHPLDPRMQPTAMQIAGQRHVAAKPWSTIPQRFLDQTSFFHHATYTPVHGEMPRVQTLMGAMDRDEMLVSAICKELAQPLGTLQDAPISLGAINGSELLRQEGRLISNASPKSLKSALAGLEGNLGRLQDQRDRDIDALYDLYREQGTPSQLRLLDEWARSRDQVRSIGLALVQRLETITTDSAKDQAKAAAILAAMNVSPVLTIKLFFGGDNHADDDLAGETNAHVSTLPTLIGLLEELESLRSAGHLKHDVVVGSLNVFGRTLKRKERRGRDHNRGHHGAFLIGPGVRGGVVGGIEFDPQPNEYRSQSIDSTTGAAGGDIPYEETLSSFGKTLGAVLGVGAKRLDELIDGGKVVQSVVG